MCYNKFMDINTFVQNLTTPELIVAVAISAVMILFGYRIKKIAFFIIWFLLGYSLMEFLMPTITNLSPEISANELYRTLIPIGGGVLLALLGFSIEKICLGGICFALTLVITAQYFGTEMQTLAIGAVVGVVLAGIAVALMKPATIVATSVAGAYALTIALLAMVPNLDPMTHYWPILIGVSVLGSLFQFLTTKRMS